MNITLIGSATRYNLMMSGFHDGVPWENLFIYREFILHHINQKILVIDFETYENPFFKLLSLQAGAQILLVTKQKIKERSENLLRVCCTMRSATMFAKKSGFTDITIVSGLYDWKALLKKVTEIFLMQVDIIIKDGMHRFPNLRDYEFHMASKLPQRVEKPNTLFIRNRCRASDITPIEIQHWFPRKKKTKKKIKW